MGTRADFYIGRGKDARWVGSTAWDGYPEGITPSGPRGPGRYDGRPSLEWPENEGIFDAKTEDEFLARLEAYFENREDVTRPEMGWPWPWEDSRTTDYAYAFDGGKVYVSGFGRAWLTPAEYAEHHANEDAPELPHTAEFPDMSGRSAVTFGPRSGVIVVGT